MFFWDWSAGRRLAVIAVMFGIANAVWLSVLLTSGLLPGWKGWLGGTAFLMTPQISGWMLFVGLKTGKMPMRGEPESRSENPVWFWIIAAMYGGTMLISGGCVIAFLTVFLLSLL